jgi:hypothetical protein
MDAGCPCAEFDGGARHGRKAYARCVRKMIRSALRGGTLRKSCKGLVRQSTCGRHGSVVCCEEQLKTGARTCRAIPAARCVSRRRVKRTVEVGSTHCADTDCTLLLATTTSTSVTTTSTLITATSSTTTSTTSTTSTTLAASWAAIHAAVVQPSCGSCHSTQGNEGGLGGLESCGTGYTSLVNVPSLELPSMDLVEPGDPTRSWLVYKLDGSRHDFDMQCVGGSCGGPMPLNRPQLLPAERDAIRAWIMNGAVNDCP